MYRLRRLPAPRDYVLDRDTYTAHSSYRPRDSDFPPLRTFPDYPDRDFSRSRLSPPRLRALDESLLRPDRLRAEPVDSYLDRFSYPQLPDSDPRWAMNHPTYAHVTSSTRTSHLYPHSSRFEPSIPVKPGHIPSILDLDPSLRSLYLSHPRHTNHPHSNHRHPPTTQQTATKLPTNDNKSGFNPPLARTLFKLGCALHHLDNWKKGPKFLDNKYKDILPNINLPNIPPLNTNQLLTELITKQKSDLKDSIVLIIENHLHSVDRELGGILGSTFPNSELDHCMNNLQKKFNKKFMRNQILAEMQKIISNNLASQNNQNPHTDFPPPTNTQIPTKSTRPNLPPIVVDTPLAGKRRRRSSGPGGGPTAPSPSTKNPRKFTPIESTNQIIPHREPSSYLGLPSTSRGLAQDSSGSVFTFGEDIIPMDLPLDLSPSRITSNQISEPLQVPTIGEDPSVGTPALPHNSPGSRPPGKLPGEGPHNSVLPTNSPLVPPGDILSISHTLIPQFKPPQDLSGKDSLPHTDLHPRNPGSGSTPPGDLPGQGPTLPPALDDNTYPREPDLPSVDLGSTSASSELVVRAPPVTPLPTRPKLGGRGPVDPLPPVSASVMDLTADDVPTTLSSPHPIFQPKTTPHRRLTLEKTSLHPPSHGPEKKRRNSLPEPSGSEKLPQPEPPLPSSKPIKQHIFSFPKGQNTNQIVQSTLFAPNVTLAPNLIISDSLMQIITKIPDNTSLIMISGLASGSLKVLLERLDSRLMLVNTKTLLISVGINDHQDDNNLDVPKFIHQSIKSLKHTSKDLIVSLTTLHHNNYSDNLKLFTTKFNTDLLNLRPQLKPYHPPLPILFHGDGFHWHPSFADKLSPSLKEHLSSLNFSLNSLPLKT